MTPKSQLITLINATSKVSFFRTKPAYPDATALSSYGRLALIYMYSYVNNYVGASTLSLFIVIDIHQ